MRHFVIGFVGYPDISTFMVPHFGQAKARFSSPRGSGIPNSFPSFSVFSHISSVAM
jgi:hypothetical protein